METLDRAVVTGATGLVGRALAARLARPLATLSFGASDWRERLARADLRGATVFHLAARVHRPYDADEQAYERDNVGKDECARRGRRRRGRPPPRVPEQREGARRGVRRASIPCRRPAGPAGRVRALEVGRGARARAHRRAHRPRSHRRARAAGFRGGRRRQPARPAAACRYAVAAAVRGTAQPPQLRARRGPRAPPRGVRDVAGRRRARPSSPRTALPSRPRSSWTAARNARTPVTPLPMSRRARSRPPPRWRDAPRRRAGSRARSKWKRSPTEDALGWSAQVSIEDAAREVGSAYRAAIRA